MMRFAFFCILVFLISCTAVYALETIDADNPNIQYTGRIYFGDIKAPVFYWPGSFLIANFQGTSINIKYNDTGNNYMAVIIDDGPYTVLDCNAGDNTYVAATGLADTTHKIQLFKRTETQQREFRFKGFELDDGKGLLPPPPRPQRRIEFYGDSITTGLALDSAGDEQTPPYTNNYLAYGALTARNLDADYHCISVSGIGIYKSWFAANMPDDYYDRHDTSTTWDFSQWIPHIVVINLGQNDYSLGTTQAQAEAGYISFAQTLRGHYPYAHIIFALGSMSASQIGSPWPGYVQNAVDALNANGDSKVYSCIFPYQGFYSHPHAPQHEAMATQLTNFILTNIPDFDLGNSDINNDRKVNLIDFLKFWDQWLQTGCDLCDGAELSGDGDIDINDLLVLADDWLMAAAPVAHWTLDETSGTTAYDYEGGNDGTLIGDSAWTTGQVDGALYFDGDGDYVEVAGYNGVIGIQSRTCSAWVNVDADAEGGVIVNWGQASGVDGGRWRFMLDSGSGALRVHVTGGRAIATTNVIGTGWRHVAVVFENDGDGDVSDVRFYVDGVFDPISSSLAMAVNTTYNQKVSIGAALDGSTPDKYFKGQIDDLRIYDRAFSDADVEMLYDKGL
jgi:carbohydrate esterase-like protein/concanavalin A-like lectin/glucanase superfamily protein/GDSL-like lipase/acylhydrolase family protein